MKRELKEIKLSNCTVKIITYLLWGEKEAIQSAIIEGAELGENGLKGYDPSALLEAKYKLLEVGIREIVQGDGAISSFSRGWMDNLRIEDGDTLYNALDELQGKKK